jgi:hypothetical protein
MWEGGLMWDEEVHMRWVSENVDSKLRVEHPGTFEKEELENHSNSVG